MKWTPNLVPWRFFSHLLYNDDGDDADVGIEPRTSSIKTTAEALSRVNDLVKFASKFQDEAQFHSDLKTDYFNFDYQMSNFSVRK